MVSELPLPWPFPIRNSAENPDLFPSAMEDFEQKMERYRREDRERQQRYDEKWELFRKKQKESYDKICNSLTKLAQSIREYQQVSDPSSVAPQVFDESSEQKLVLEDLLSLQGKIEDELEQPEIVEEGHSEALKLQKERVSPFTNQSYSLPFSISDLNPEPQFVARFYISANLKPNPTFRSPLITRSWTQNTPEKHDVNLFSIRGQNLMNQNAYKLKIESTQLYMPCAPKDSNLGDTFAFTHDTNLNKLDLGAGTCRTAEGNPLFLNTMKLQMEKSPNIYDKRLDDPDPNGKGSFDDGDAQTIKPYEGNLSQVDGSLVIFLFAPQDCNKFLSLKFGTIEQLAVVLCTSNCTTVNMRIFGAVAARVKLPVEEIQGREKETILLAVFCFVHSWGQECSKGGGNMTLIDVPDITKVPMGDQPSEIIRKMIMTQIKQENHIILGVTPANSNLATSEALQMAKEADPSDSRTTGVITKLDIMDRGTDAHTLLLGRVIPLRLGCVGIVNRCQEDINYNKSIRDALTREEQFFCNHCVYKGLFDVYKGLFDQCGIPQLAKKLNILEKKHIRMVLPNLKTELQFCMNNLSKELKAYGEVVKSKTEQGEILLNILRNYCEGFIATVDGKSQENCTKEQFGGARIQCKFLSILSKSLEGVNPWENITDHGIRVAIQDATSLWNALFVPKVPFEVLVRNQVARLLDPSLQCLRFAYDELIKVSYSCKPPELKRYPCLRRNADKDKRFMRAGVGPAENIIRNIIEMEIDYINSAHPNYIGGDKAFELPRQQLNSSLDNTNVERASTSKNGQKSTLPIDSIAGDVSFSILVQRTWLTLVLPLSEDGQISPTPTLLLFLMSSIHDSRGNDEADILYSKDGLKNFLIFHMIKGCWRIVKAVLDFAKVYAIQKYIECGLEYHTPSIISTFFYQVLAAQPHGCCVIQTRLELHVMTVANPGKFRSVWQVQFTAFLHSWGQECSEGEGIVTILSMN